MDAARDNRPRLGQLMVDEGFLTEEQLAHALAEQSRTGRPLGAILVELGFVSAGAVGNVLAEQHGGLLKTEFGISAGLHVLSVEEAPVAPAAPVAAAAPAAPPAPSPSAPDPSAARVRELESHLREILTERNSFAQRLNELQPRLAEAAQAQATEVDRVTAAAAAHIDELEAELRAAVGSREEIEAAVRLGATRIAELQREVAELRVQGEHRQAEQVAEVAALEQAHLLFIPSCDGYRLLEWPGPAPASGTLLDVDGAGFVVGRVGVSPLPGIRLRCAFLAAV